MHEFPPPLWPLTNYGLAVLANRDRDRSDVQDVLFIQGELDRACMTHWAEQLGGATWCFAETCRSTRQV